MSKPLSAKTQWEKDMYLYWAQYWAVACNSVSISGFRGATVFLLPPVFRFKKAFSSLRAGKDILLQESKLGVQAFKGFMGWGFTNRIITWRQLESLAQSGNKLTWEVKLVKLRLVLRGIAGRPASLGKFAGGWRRSKFTDFGLICSRGPGAAPPGAPANLRKLAVQNS